MKYSRAKLQSNFVSGSLILTVSSLIVSGGNYLANILLAHWLGPVDFADVNLILSIIITLTFIVTTLTLATAKFAAVHSAQNDSPGLGAFRRRMTILALMTGLLMGACFAIGAPVLMQFFQFRSGSPFLILAISLPFSNLLGVERGILQGQARFSQLAVSLQIEMWVRLLAIILVIYLKWSATGVALSLLVSFILPWILAMRVNAGLSTSVVNPDETYKEIVALARPLVIALLGQVLINNADILLVKYFYPKETAGQYAVLALVGRIVFFANWPIVMALFSVAAQNHEKGEPHDYLLRTALAIIGVLSALITLVCFAIPVQITMLLFGPAYLPIAPLLWLYAAGTTFYVIANAIVNYRIAVGDSRLTKLVLWVSFTQIGLLLILHRSLFEVVLIQIVAMAGLMAVVLSLSAFRESPVS
jgi:O-antigen/teichoic acid export membrane protein